MATDIAVGDRVVGDFEGGRMCGTVEKLLGKKLKILFDDGDRLILNRADVSPVLEEDEDDTDEDASVASEYYNTKTTPSPLEEFPQGGGKGFSLYPVVWDENTLNFGVDMEDGSRFFGCWRLTVYGDTPKTRKEGYAVDIWARYKGHDYSVESIPYLGSDPRLDMKSLTADICAAISQFMFRVENDADNLELLRKKAARPRVHISRIESIDRAIMKLTEIRDVAIRSGGQRICTIQGDRETDPILGVVIDVTQQALLLEGKVPPIESGQGAIYDAPAGKGGDGRAAIFKADPKSIAALVERLRTSTDKAQARKIRQVLRRMGHRGGARSATTNNTSAATDSD